MVSAVLFDMDGLLFDSERTGAEIITRAVKEQGFMVSPDTLKAMLGVTDAVAQAILIAAVPGVDAVRVWAAYADGMFSLARQGKMPLKAGAIELLDALDMRGIPAAVASSNSEYAVHLYLRCAGIFDRFRAVVTRGEGLRSKPAPDLFLRAAEELGVSPENCLVLEDSFNGLKAGRAAGMKVCMIPDMIPYDAECAPYCDSVTDTMADVIALLSA